MANSIGLRPENIPQELKGRRQWVVWKSEIVDGRRTKILYQTDGTKAKVNASETWTSYADALACYKTGEWDGIGYVFAADDPYCGIDVDGCRNPETGELDRFAREIVERFPTYTEISPSGTGIKLILKGKLPVKPPRTGAKTRDGAMPGDGYGEKKPGIESYQERRWFALTGVPLTGAPSDVCEADQADLNGWFQQTFHRRASAPKVNGQPTGNRQALIDRARKYLDTMPPAIDGQRGSDVAFRAACVLVCRFGLSEDEALEAIAEWNARCEPPWSEAELRHKLQDAAQEPITLDLINETDSQRKGLRVKPARPISRSVDELTWKPFPVDVFPEPVRTYLVEASAALDCDVSLIALPVLAVLASCIGNSRRIELKKSWTEPSVIWVTTIAPPSSLKSPAWQLACQPLWDIQQQFLDEYRLQMDAYENELRLYDVRFSEWKRRGFKSGDDPPVRPEPPICTRLHTSDATVEALVALLVDNPRGLLYAVDELAGFLNNLNRYSGGKGGDIQAYLSMQRAGPVTTDRKTGQRTMHIPRAAVSICGTIQPGIFGKFANSPEIKESGFLARLLFACPPVKPKRWTDNDISASTQRSFAELLRKLLALALRRDGEAAPEPLILPLTGDALELWKEFVAFLSDISANVDEALAAHWGKLEAYGARFALVLQLVDNPDAEEIGESAVMRAIGLAKWFVHEVRRVLGIVSETDDERRQRELLAFIQQRGGEITVRELTHDWRRYRDATAQAEADLNALRDARFGEWIVTPPGPQGGKPKRLFRIYPSVTVTDTHQFKVENRGSGDGDAHPAAENSSGDPLPNSDRFDFLMEPDAFD